MSDSADRQAGYGAELENYFRTSLVDGAADRSRELWARDYSSVEAYSDSVQDRRLAWRRVLSPPELHRIDDVKITTSDASHWLVVPLDHHLTAQGQLVVPPGATKLVVFQHGLGSTPERVMGTDDPHGTYDRVGERLICEGYAVLAPMNLIGISARNRAQSLARLAGTTMEGLEFARFQALLDAVWEVAPGLDRHYAFAGMSWGGLAAQFWTPLDDRAVAVASLGFFNDRERKMVVQDTRYATFHDTGEDHAFLFGHLNGFGDADLASLITPRPFLVQHGRSDLIGWWPQIAEEFDRAKVHWERLGVADRVELQLHPGGHVVEADGLIRWLGLHFPARRDA